MREKLAGAGDAALHLVKDEKRAGGVADLAKRLQEALGRGADAALALNRFDQDRRGGLGDGVPHRLQIVPGQMFEPGQQRAEALDHLFRSGGGDGGRGPAMEGAREGEDVGAFGLALFVKMLAHHLHRQFAGLGPRIGEEDGIGKGMGHQHVGQPFLFRDPVEVRDMPELARLFGQRRHQFGRGMAERVDRDPGAQIKVSAAIRGPEPGALATHEGEGGTGVGRQHGSDHLRLLKKEGQGVQQARGGCQRSGTFGGGFVERVWRQATADRASGAGAATSGTGKKGGPGDHACPLAQGAGQSQRK